MADLALVQCPGWGRESPPYALACLAACVRAEGFSVPCFDLNNACYHAAPEGRRRLWEDKDLYSCWEDAELVREVLQECRPAVEDAAARILESGARAVGLSVQTTSLLASLEFARLLKERDPSLTVIFGGPQCSRSQAGSSLALEPCVDAVVVGEGERTLVEFLRSPRPMPGVLVREAGRVVDSGDAPGPEDLDSLPLPDYSDFESDMRAGRYASPHRVDILDSRGCVRRCHFCSEWQSWGRYRSMSGERVFRELKEHVDRFPRVSHAYFIGSLLNGDLRALERFCDRALESGMRLSWEGQAIVDPRMDRRLLGKMARAGCVWLGFGIESGSEALRGRMNKGFSNEDALRNLKDAHDAGIRVQANFMFGLPTETREDFEQTLRFLTLCRPHIDSVLASQSFAVLDKGTALHRRAGEFGIEGRDHHLYWTSDNGTNDYAERFRRYEKFCSLALELGLPETSGVLRVKPDKWLLLGRYHMRREDYSSAVRCLERSALEEAAGRSARADLAECRERSIAVNRKELEERKTALSAPPRLLTLGTHHPCNARCVFCLEGEAPRFSLELYKSRFEARLGHFIRRAEKVTFTGFGEVLLAPDAPAWLDHLNATIPETWKIFTTNGTPLRGEIVERLLKSRYVVQLSLHAADSALHEELTGLKGAFQGIVRSLGELCSLRRERDLGDRLHVVLVSVVTRRSAGSLADLVRLAWELKVPEVQCHYVTVFNEAHIPQSCFFDQERANEAIAAAQEALDRIRSGADPEEAKHFQVSLPPRFGAGQDSRAGSVCPEPWEHVYVEAQGPVLPCCQWGEHIGNLDAGDDLDALWNGPFYRGFRSSMASGDPHPWCGRCARYRGYNVDNLLCHLTNRPEQQKALLEAIGTWTRA